MSLKSSKAGGVPRETQKIAKAAFPKGNVYIWMREELGELYQDSLFAGLYSETGQPALAPSRLALVVIMQFMEGLSDRQAAEAVRARIDWKYALGLELDDPGFDYSVLSEFRARLGRSPEKQLLLNVLLDELRKRGWLKARGKQRTDSTHVLAAIRSLNRLELVGETMRRALNELAEVDPDWVKGIAKPAWYPRYAQRIERLRLPKKDEEREQLTLAIGQDGFDLLEALWAVEGKEELRQLPGVKILQRVWIQQYWLEYSGGDDGPLELRLRADDNQPPGEQRIHSPYDVDVRYSAKRSGEWVGYKVTLTETCDEGLPHLLTHVETTSAVVQDVSLTERIHQSLQAKQLLPTEHLMDAGFIDAELLVGAQADFGVTIWGPVKKDVRWQANQAEGFGLSDFHIDWEQRTVTCPQGKIATAWSESKNAYGHRIQQVKFKPSDCQACSFRSKCTRSKRGSRYIGFLPQPEHEALQQARQQQKTAAFWKRYAKRSGIEGTISQGVRAFDLRRTRYIGLAKTSLQMMITALAINLDRLYNWITQSPLALTRTSHFAQLAPAPAMVSGSWRTP